MRLRAPKVGVGVGASVRHRGTEAVSALRCTKEFTIGIGSTVFCFTMAGSAAYEDVTPATMKSAGSGVMNKSALLRMTRTSMRDTVDQ